MNKLKIIKKLSMFEDPVWVAEQGYNKRLVRMEISEMGKSEMKEWIVDAIKLFHEIIESQ